MRILFASWPGYGHLLPMVPMIRAAQQGGHDVVVSSGADMSALIGRLGVTTHRSGVTSAESYARMPDHATISELPADQQPGFAARHLFGAGAVDRAHDLLGLLQRGRPDLVVHDTLERGPPPAAALHGTAPPGHRLSHPRHGHEPHAALLGPLPPAVHTAPLLPKRPCCPTVERSCPMPEQAPCWAPCAMGYPSCACHGAPTSRPTPRLCQ